MFDVFLFTLNENKLTLLLKKESVFTLVYS